MTPYLAAAPVPYYSDDHVQLYLGDCREITEWLAADVLAAYIHHNETSTKPDSFPQAPWQNPTTQGA